MFERAQRCGPVLSLGVLAILAVPAGAATRCVNPQGTGGCRTTIQGAVDEAGPGDLIRIAPGTYFENVKIPAGKEGLKLLGAGKLATILDPDAPDLPDDGVAIHIRSDGVSIRNLGIRNGRSIGVVIQADDVVVQGLRIVAAKSHGITTNGAPRNLQILGNEIRAVGEFGIQVFGHAAVVRGNVVARTGNVGIGVSGDAPTVQANRVSGGPLGIFASCTVCAGGLVASNTVTDVAGPGILAQPPEEGLVVRGNVISRSLVGLELRGPGTTVQLNRVTDVGQGQEGACFLVAGDDTVLENNTATRCSGPGFRVKGGSERIRLAGNQAVGAFENGFSIAGSEVVLERNRATSCSGQGFAVVSGAQDAALTDNTASKNRLDYCNDGSGTTLTGNRFGTTADTADTDCVIDRSDSPD